MRGGRGEARGNASEPDGSRMEDGAKLSYVYVVVVEGWGWMWECRSDREGVIGSVLVWRYVGMQVWVLGEGICMWVWERG